MKILATLLLSLLASCASDPACEVALLAAPPDLAADVAELMLELPLESGVEVRVGPMREYGLLGRAVPGEPHRLYLDESLTPIEMRDVLVHEWAHLWAWQLGLPEGEDGHGASWGRAYSEVYRALLD